MWISTVCKMKDPYPQTQIFILLSSVEYFIDINLDVWLYRLSCDQFCTVLQGSSSWCGFGCWSISERRARSPIDSAPLPQDSRWWSRAGNEIWRGTLTKEELAFTSSLSQQIILAGRSSQGFFHWVRWQCALPMALTGPHFCEIVAW